LRGIQQVSGRLWLVFNRTHILAFFQSNDSFTAPIITETMTPDTQAVHLIFKTHLDIGFVDFAQTIVANYFTRFIPDAIALAKALRERGGSERHIWTTGSWLIYEYLEQASPAERRALEAAIETGDIVWHGLPFTTHSELMDTSLFRFGLSLSQQLDRRFGRKTIAAKMTDVPGHTRGIVPLLAEAGIQFLHIGVNLASTPPDAPPLFVWQDPGGASVVVIYQHGYGDLMLPEGMNEAIAFAHTGDNVGPQTVDEVLAIFRDMRRRFPGARVFASTMDDYARKLLSIRSRLPVVTAEIGDTWIHGVGSDPGKVAQYRELSRLRREWLDSGNADPGDAHVTAFSRSLIMIPEHTWGLDEKTHLADYTHYSAYAFKIAKKQPNFKKFETSWAEQRAYLTAALKAVEGTPLGDEAERRLDAIQPRLPTTAGFTQESYGAFETLHFHIQFEHPGIISMLVDKNTGRQWASPGRGLLGLVRYQAFSKAEYDRFYRAYIRNKKTVAVWAVHDYTKPGLETAAPQRALWIPMSSLLRRRIDDAGQYFLLELDMPEEASTIYGCPRRFTVEIAAPNHTPRLEFVVQWFDKPASRLPEAIWFSFAPITPDVRGWQMDKLGELISPLDVIRSGNRRLHAVGSGVYYRDNRGQLAIEPLDAPLVAPGEPSLLDFSNRQPSLKKGMHFNLYNNLWGTNFPMWYEENARFRFALDFS
jgi:hypothetical protein